MKPNRCWMCKHKFTKKNCPPCVLRQGSGLCRACARLRARRIYGHKPKNLQVPNTRHTFSCGCIGLLPKKGRSNQFAYYTSPSWQCRVAKIIHTNIDNSRNCGYLSIDPNTPHSIIRKLMEDPNCERCGQPLKWEFGYGKTPHLHHNHTTGEIYGFTHPRCNPNALEQEIERLREIIAKLSLEKQQLPLAPVQ
jgi:hypothetical protein